MNNNKFNAKKTIIDGITFDSKKEASYYIRLGALMRAKNESDRVVNIELQPRYDIIINDEKIGHYKADFKVDYADGRTEIIDVKGYKKGAAYQLFRLKKKVIEALHNIKIIEK
jgi:hypothetical protein